MTCFVFKSAIWAGLGGVSSFLLHSASTCVDAGCWWDFSWGCQPEHLHVTFLCGCLVSSQRGGWILRARVPRGPGGSSITLISLRNHVVLPLPPLQACLDSRKGNITLSVLNGGVSTSYKRSRWNRMYWWRHLWRIQFTMCVLWRCFSFKNGVSPPHILRAKHSLKFYTVCAWI